MQLLWTVKGDSISVAASLPAASAGYLGVGFTNQAGKMYPASVTLPPAHSPCAPYGLRRARGG